MDFNVTSGADRKGGGHGEEVEQREGGSGGGRVNSWILTFLQSHRITSGVERDGGGGEGGGRDKERDRES